MKYRYRLDTGTVDYDGWDEHPSVVRDNCGRREIALVFEMDGDYIDYITYYTSEYYTFGGGVVSYIRPYAYSTTLRACEVLQL